jgi:hypothetical protein
VYVKKQEGGNNTCTHTILYLRTHCLYSLGVFMFWWWTYVVRIRWLRIINVL